MEPVAGEQQKLSETRQLRTIGLALLAVAALLLFLWLGEDVHTSRTQDVDNQVRTRVHAWASPALTRLMLRITQLGSTLTVTTLAVVTVVVFLKVKSKRATILLATDLAMALVLNTFLKDVFHRPRPQPFLVFHRRTPTVFPAGTRCFRSAFTECWQRFC